MTKRYREMTDTLMQQLQPDEQIEEVALFNSLPTMCSYFVFSAVTFAVGRIFTGSHAITLLSGIFSMWMMVNAAQTLYYTHNSCVLVTNQRTFGHIGEKRFSLPHVQIRQILLSRFLFLDSGDAHSSVLLRHVSNRQTLHAAITRYRCET